MNDPEYVVYFVTKLKNNGPRLENLHYFWRTASRHKFPGDEYGMISEIVDFFAPPEYFSSLRRNFFRPEKIAIFSLIVL